MTDTETAALTKEVIALHNEVTEFGRKSVSLIVQCGKKLTEIQNALPKGKWMEWQQEHGDVLSKSTINRYKRVYELSLVTSLDGQTLTEVYEVMKSKKKGRTESPNDDESRTTNVSGDMRPLKVIEDLVNQIIEIIDVRVDESERDEAFKLIYPIVDFYNDRMPLKEAA